MIIPARDEERRLPVLLASLVRQEGVASETIVVDDQSSDGTAAVAARFPVRVVSGRAPPEGWAGKCFACWQGAMVARGTWLLFTDADTRHEPGALPAALSAATEAGAGLFSMTLRQRCATFWERLLLPFAYQQYFVGLGPPARRGAGRGVANGQFLLCRADAYRRVGGHRAIRGSVIDDVALARLFVASGEPVVLARGEALAEVRMYESLAGIVRGFAKNSVRFLAVEPLAGAVVAASTALAAAPAGVALIGLGRRDARQVAVAAAAYVASIPGYAAWLRCFGVPLVFAPLQPVAAAVFQGIALVAAWRAVAKRTTLWKGRAV